MKALFRSLAAAFKKAAPAQAVAGVLLLGLSLYTGYQIPKPSMIGALRWISYINVSPEIHRIFIPNSLTILRTAYTIRF
jgi:ABC-type multidrug transport system permease subunit